MWTLVTYPHVRDTGRPITGRQFCCGKSGFCCPGFTKTDIPGEINLDGKNVTEVIGPRPYVKEVEVVLIMSRV